MLRYLLNGGRFFFILDSFDEIPQVLNDARSESWLIGGLSNAIHDFLTGGFEARGVLASRLFRQPTRAFDAQAILELRPFTDIQIRDSLKRAKAYSEETIGRNIRDAARLGEGAQKPVYSRVTSGVFAGASGRTADVANGAL